MFFYGNDGNSSKYAQSILNTLIDYEGLSDKERMVVDLFSSINCYGDKGLGVPSDMVNEWAVKAVKQLKGRQATNYEATLANRCLRAQNTLIDMKKDLFESVMIDTSKSSGGHSAKVVKEEEVELLR